MIKKYNNHTQQTNPRHCEEKQQNTNSHKTSGRQSKATSSLFLIKMIAKLERTQSNAYQNKDQTQNPYTQWEVKKQRINNNRTTSLEQTAV